MTEFIVPLQQIQKLPSEVHLLCPRYGADSQDRFEEDIEGRPLPEDDKSTRSKRIKEARARRKTFISCLQLLAYDGAESESYQKFIWDSLDKALGNCDICIRSYYVDKMHFLSDLREEYEETDIKAFFDIIDRRDQTRIIQGLEGAAKTLKALPENKRGTNALEIEQLHSIFEALLCDSFLRSEELVTRYFDEPFRLIQTKKPLKIREIVPATVRFIFSSRAVRLGWANSIWGRLDRTPSDLEWTWAMKDCIQERLRLAATPADATRLWSGLKIMADKMNQEFITFKLFDLQPSICITALDHLSWKTDAVAFITQTFKIILDKAPDAFWHAMGSISSQTVIEQIFNSPLFVKSLETFVKAEEQDKANLDVLVWVPSFLAALKPANRPVACSAFATQLFKVIESPDASLKARAACLEMAVKVMLQTTLAFSDSEKNRLAVERVVILDSLNTIGQYLERLLSPRSPELLDEISASAQTEILSLVRNSVALECQCLKNDHESLASKQALKHEPIHSASIWQVVQQNLSDGSVKLASSVLCGTMAFPGLEPLRINAGDALTKDKRNFNAAFDKITGAVSGVLGKIADFQPQHLDSLFKQQETSMSLISALFSADQTTYETAVDLLKNISGEQSRKDALSHLIDAFFGVTIYSLCWTLRRIANMKTFSSVPRMLKASMEVLDILCNSTTGKLRRLKKLESRDFHAIQGYWSYQWIALKTVFKQMEPWSLEIHDKALMTEVCRDAMQFAEELFEQYDVFSNILTLSKPDKAAEITKALLEGDDTNSGSPVLVLDAMAKWLRLRDQYLANTLVTLITKMLFRLKQYRSTAEIAGLGYVQEVAMTSSVKTILTDTQKATLIRALENWHGRQLAKPMKKKQSTLKDWTDRSGAATPSSRAGTADDFGDSDIPDDDLYEVPGERVDGRKNELKPKVKEKSVSLPLKLEALKARKPDPILMKAAARQQQDSKAFIEERKRERELQKARDKESAARMRAEMGVGAQTKDQGSGLSGLGVVGKDHSVRKSEMMVSSDSDSDLDSDEELFGKMPTAGKPKVNQAVMRKPLPIGPVRKIKQQRSQKDVRARLAPDLSSLHKTILSWDFFADTDLPPHSAKDDYTLVTNKFQTAADYQKTFEPLLVLEGWQGFRSAREDGSFKPFEFKVANSLIIDSFFEINSTVSMNEGRELGISPSDVVLLSKSRRPDGDANEPHCLARVKEITRKKGEMQIVYRVNAANNPLRPHLHDKATIYGVQILSLTPLEREYGALMALPYYDLCDEIIAAKPSPLLDYDDRELQQFVNIYDVNKAQARAVKSAVDNDAFTLVQGPPGSGKTKTICAIVGAIMTGHLSKGSSNGPRLNTANAQNPSLPRAAKKVLVCAPSNAAVDELVMRFKKGVKMMHGSTESLSVVRLGRSEAINSQVKDVTLEELVNARLNVNGSKDQKEDIQAIMMQHKATSNELNELRDKINTMRSNGQPIPPSDERAVDGLKRKKASLGTKIDDMKQKQNSASRDAELHRKRIQQQILDSAHVLCATLSGSGHEIFQGLNVEFETVIIDEAAQSIELSALIPLKYGCSKCILVGDPKQLPPTVLSREAAKFQYEQSLFARMEKNHKKDVHLLDTQYRMHPEISLFPSRMFYDSKLRDGTNMAELRRRPWHHSSVLAPYRFFDVQGMSESATKGHSLINVAELSIAMKLYDRLTKDMPKYDFKGKIGIITPYKGQLKELKLRFKQRYGDNITSTIEFNTTDAFQGRESEIIIFSCVRASTKGIGFLNDIRRMNVGLTRAKCSLWVLGNSQSLIQGEFWRGLVNDAMQRNLYTDGDIHGLLSRPLLTEDMMKDDVEMGGMDSPMVIADDVSTRDVSRPPSVKPEPTRRGSDSSRNVTPLLSRPTSALSRRSSSSSSVANTSRPQPGRRNSNPNHLPRRPPSSNTNNTNNTNNTSFQPKKPEAPLSTEQISSSYVTPRYSTADDARPVSRGTGGPSGGRFGFNDLARCRLCGSDEHFTFNCSNEEARAAMHGNCFRCFKLGHSAIFCSEPRCFECGQVGHISARCQAPPRLRLTPEQRQDVLKQERRSDRKKEEAMKRRAEKQLGEHGAKIPEVKSSLVPTEPKRKRESEDAPPANVLKALRMSGNLPAKPSSALTEPAAMSGVRPPGQQGVSRPPQMIKKKKKVNADEMFVKRR